MADRYRDLDLDFLPHPLNGDIVIKTDAEAIKRSLRNLIQFTRSDKPFHPEISSGVRDLLFEPNHSIIAIRLEQEIKKIIMEYEPRVVLQNISVRSDLGSNGYEITIKFSIRNDPRPLTMNFALQRLK